MKRLSTWMRVCAVGLMVGCGGTLEEDAPADAPEGQEQDELFTQTIVRALPDGTQSQETTLITRREQLAQLEAREALLRRLGGDGVTQQDLDDLAVDGGCAGSSLWLFDKTGLVGNQLCLYKQVGASQGWLGLGGIFRYVDGTRFYTWAGAVRSLWAGEDPGSLQSCTSTLCYSDFYQNFSAYQKITATLVTDPLGSTRRLNQAYLYDP